MAEPLARALARVRSLLLDDAALVRAVASGRRRAAEPRWRRAEVRYVDLGAGRRLQLTTYDQTQAHTTNHRPDQAQAAVDDLLDQPFASWHVETATETLQLRVTKKGAAVMHTAPHAEPLQVVRGHDRPKSRLLPEDDPVLRALGVSDERGRVKPSRQAKYRQVEQLLRALDAALDDARLRAATVDRPLHVVDLGCGNALLTFAAHRYLIAVRGLPVRLTGVDVKAQSGTHVQAVAERLGTDQVRFVRSAIGEAQVDPRPDVVLALHACDTATDDALARAVRWEAPVVLAAPCCHHDVAAQLRRAPPPAPYAMLTRHGILRERFADTLTDALRASLLRQVGYRVDVVEFVESRHTPRNTLLRAVRTGAAPSARTRAELDELTTTWRVRPRLAELLDDRLR